MGLVEPESTITASVVPGVQVQAAPVVETVDQFAVLLTAPEAVPPFQKQISPAQAASAGTAHKQASHRRTANNQARMLLLDIADRPRCLPGATEQQTNIGCRSVGVP